MSGKANLFCTGQVSEPLVNEGISSYMVVTSLRVTEAQEFV